MDKSIDDLIKQIEKLTNAHETLTNALEYHMQREKNLETIVTALGDMLDGIFGCLDDDIQQLPHIASWREQFKELRRSMQ